MKKLTQICGLLLAGSAALFGDGPRVTVANLDYTAVRGNVAEIFGSDIDIGRGVADMLEAKLTTCGKFRVYERRNLGAVLDEQDTSHQERFDPRTAVRIGELAGSEVVIIGSITQFGKEDPKQGYNLGGLAGGLGGRIPLKDIRVGGHGAKASIEVTLKVVNARTGEILAQAAAMGKSKNTSKGIGGMVTIGGRSLDLSSGLGSPEFAQTMVGEAMSAAIGELVKQLTAPGTLARIVP
jgi:curli biogenesis system outer membrane secretion channel CsgG